MYYIGQECRFNWEQQERANNNARKKADNMSSLSGNIDKTWFRNGRTSTAPNECQFTDSLS
jgi:hypothetical protein